MTEESDLRLLRPAGWRLARAARLAALRDAPQHFLPARPHESSWGAGRWRRSCETGRWAVARSAGAVAGLARLTDNPDGLHIESVWTRPDRRRRGIASALVRLLVDSEPGRDILVWVIQPNAAALRLYLSLGFEPTFERQVLDGRGRIEERLRLSGKSHPA
ncbi:GNAT family N-acetyltransferase [Symbioplanes lichenis]|uniref:GNAT family N-acetyltransferase n=1 Tax=Symbioplanes lichenis TaxID=1629072 RepID=UPI002738F67F|nr:GNAT family N-acetyltransferase [Actinoplanes lichenis]